MKTIPLLCILFISAQGVSFAEEYVIGQKNKAFTKDIVKAAVGDTVTFINNDPFFHNIYSLSGAQPFDLGSYPKGKKRSLALTSEGVLEVECAIHPEMKMTIKVNPKE